MKNVSNRIFAEIEQKLLYNNLKLIIDDFGCNITCANHTLNDMIATEVNYRKSPQAVYISSLDKGEACNIYLLLPHVISHCCSK